MTQSNAFKHMSLSPGMLKTIETIGFENATPIQQKSIPELLQGRDLLGQAQTGTGKTAAFAIPVIETIDPESKDIQALLVCPTRELCLQVCQEIQRLSAHTVGISVIALYGGQAIEQQLKALRSHKPQIVVATPGRLFDHLRRKSIELSKVRKIVLDEADEMLDMGFREEIEQIFDLLPEENQRIFFSATMPKTITALVRNYLRDPVIIKTEASNMTVKKISQSFFRVRGKEKTELLCRVLDHSDPKLAVVFCNAKSTADEIVDEIKFRGFEAGVLHGDLSQNQRDRVMAKFKSGQIRVLVATDIAARGIDIEDVELVLNYHLPHDPEDYVHRIGRTGRAGRIGRAISLVEPRDNSRLRKITQFARADILEAEPPTISDVKSAKISNLFGKVRNALSSDMIREYRSILAKQDLSAEDMAAGLIKLALEKFEENSKLDMLAEEMRGRKYSGSGFGDVRRSEGSRGSREGGREWQARSPRSPRRESRDFSSDRKPENRSFRSDARPDRRESRDFSSDKKPENRPFRSDARPDRRESRDNFKQEKKSEPRFRTFERSPKKSSEPRSSDRPFNKKSKSEGKAKGPRRK